MGYLWVKSKGALSIGLYSNDKLPKSVLFKTNFPPVLISPHVDLVKKHIVHFCKCLIPSQSLENDVKCRLFFRDFNGLHFPCSLQVLSHYEFWRYILYPFKRLAVYTRNVQITPAPKYIYFP